MKRNYTRRAPLVVCPHCQHPAAIRTSEQQTRLVRELLLLCTNDACGFRFVGQIVAVRTIQPSLTPHPAVNLPPVVRSKAANDDTPVPANDERPPAADAEPMT
ncbi:ogr/Delta-like zinc finger family protein [Sphingomonas sp. NPDC079357]|uniref:ogr/Delta-like zinc finger family protein n=1 Tax=Sphingomonas sp. NPDC079357 TaxID=3364518 RepID=UPI003850D590